MFDAREGQLRNEILHFFRQAVLYEANEVDQPVILCIQLQRWLGHEPSVEAEHFEQIVLNLDELVADAFGVHFEYGGEKHFEIAFYVYQMVRVHHYGWEEHYDQVDLFVVVLWSSLHAEHLVNNNKTGCIYAGDFLSRLTLFPMTRWQVVEALWGKGWRSRCWSNNLLLWVQLRAFRDACDKN